VLTHDDEVGRIYKIDPRTGIILKSFTLDGARRGDFEAITIAGSDIYLLESNGKIYKFKEGADGSEVPYVKFDTKLGKVCEFESLAYEPDSSRLVMACKKPRKKSEDHDLVIYQLPLPLSDTTPITSITVPMSEIEGNNKWKNFHASDMNIDPATGNYVIVASREKALLVLTPDGDVVRSEPLPPGHEQAEGVAITKDSLLIVSDEATRKPADITLYRWHR
jgi:uncharacterized protein YjiK